MLRSRLTTALGATVLALASLVSAAASPPLLVRPDGSYPAVPLEKDVVVVKVVQHAPLNLQKAPTIREGLATNVERMASWIKKACSSGRRPDSSCSTSSR